MHQNVYEMTSKHHFEAKNDQQTTKNPLFRAENDHNLLPKIENQNVWLRPVRCSIPDVGEIWMLDQNWLVFQSKKRILVGF